MIDSTLSLEDLNLKGQKVLVRVDFNVPLDHGYITDDKRIVESLPTIQYIIKNGGIPILMSHLGRPKKYDSSLSLSCCATRLSELLKRPVKMAPSCSGKEVEEMVSQLREGDLLMLENLRFHKGEENPIEEPFFASSLAKLGDVYVNDAFGSAHRSHASVVDVPKLFPGKAAAGFLMQKELNYLGQVLLQPKKPFYAILGGAKISTKFTILESLMNKADALLIGGAMANTFLKSEELEIGDSLYEKDFISVARELLDISIHPYCRLLLPIDLIIADKVNPKAKTRIVTVNEGVPKGFKALDIGPQTIEWYKKELQKASTIFWNGPLGVFEYPPFANGTHAIAKAITELHGVTTIIGGGDSLAAIEQTGLSDKISHLSTGGGATLEFIEQGTLPGVEALSSKNSYIAHSV